MKACEFSTRKKISTGIGIAIALFAAGALVGKFSLQNEDSEEVKPSGTQIDQQMQNITTTRRPHGTERPSRGSCDLGRPSNDTGSIRHWFDRNRKENACASTASDCLTFGLPRHYIAYHLDDKTVKIDGKLDDAAWEEVPWSENFVDIRSEFYEQPRFDTKVKIRWDDSHLYIGAYIQETDLWGTLTTKDGQLEQENDFEIFLSADESLFNYKQIQVNVLGTIMDQQLEMSSHDTTTAWSNNNRTWSSDVKSAVHTEGSVNQPGDNDTFWSVELAFPFMNLAEYTDKNQETPSEGEAWFIQFGRAEYSLDVNNSRYAKPSPAISEWWSWQQCEAINLHLQDRWGLVQFKKNMADTAFNYRKWHLYKALFDTFDALKAYNAINYQFTDEVSDLDVPPYVMVGTCVEMPHIQILNRKEFLITIRSKYQPALSGSIAQNRQVTFT